MPYTINPKRIEDEVIERLMYQKECEVDDFTMKRFYHSLKKTIRDSKFNSKTFIALGFVLFNMKKYKEFLEIHDQARRHYEHDLEIHTHRLVGMLRLLHLKLYDLPDFDLYSSWFDTEINKDNRPFQFMYGSKRLVFVDKILDLKRENVAKITLNIDHILSFEFGPIHFIRNYFDMKDDNLFFDLSFTWEIIEKIRTNTLTAAEDLYLKDILGDKYNDFIDFVDPDYSEFIDKEEEPGQVYHSVDKFMESLMM